MTIVWIGIGVVIGLAIGIPVGALLHRRHVYHGLEHTDRATD